MAGRLDPDLLLVDILLPGIDGATLITGLRSDPQFARSRLIVVTSLDESQRAPYAFALDGVPSCTSRNSCANCRRCWPLQAAAMSAGVLLIEDDSSIAFCGAGARRAGRWTWSTAGTLAEAPAQQLAQLRFAAVITDLMLPDGSSVELMEAGHARQGTPWIAFSAGLTPERLAALHELGVRQTLRKPVSLTALTGCREQRPVETHQCPTWRNHRRRPPRCRHRRTLRGRRGHVRSLPRRLPRALRR